MKDLLQSTKFGLPKHVCAIVLPQDVCLIYIYISAAPQEVTQLVVNVISDNSVLVRWSPPARANGILTYYSVIVFSEIAGYNFSSQVDAVDDEEATISGLSAFKH